MNHPKFQSIFLMKNITYRSLSTYPVQNVQYNRAVRQDLQANSGMNGNGGGCLYENCPVWINPKQKNNILN